MRVIRPLLPAYSYVTSTTATDIADPWVSGTSYAKGDLVTHPLPDGQPYQVRRWESLVNTNVEEPGTGSDWLDTGPCNRCSMFDQQPSTTTVADSPLTVVIEPGLVTAMAFLGLVGNTLDVVVRDGAGGDVIYESHTELDGTEIYDWYQYFFEPRQQLSEVLITGIPPYLTSHVTITLTGAEGGTVSCGTCAFGTLSEIGETSIGARIGITDYSRKDTDDYGTTTFVRRGYSRRMTAQALLLRGQLPRVYRLLADLRASPAVWIGSDEGDLTPTIIYGYYRDFSVAVEYHTHVYCEIEIEGLA